MPLEEEEGRGGGRGAELFCSRVVLGNWIGGGEGEGCSDVYRYLYVGPNPTKNRKKKKKTIEFRDFLQFLPYLTGL